MSSSLNFELINQAKKTLEGHIHLTPVAQNMHLSELIGARVFFKLENLQRGGSFKIRGAMNYVSSLVQSGFSGEFVAASAGNHAQGVALASREFKLKSHIFMPLGSVEDKIESSRRFGANVELYGENVDEALAHALAYARDNGAQFIHPFEHPVIMAGQGTIGLEILEQCPEVGTVIIPVGGGGLAAGIATYLKEHHPHIHIVGVQAEVAPAMTLSWKEHSIQQPPFKVGLADGISVKKPSEMMLNILSSVLDDMVVVSEEEIAQAMLFLILRGKMLVEGAGAVSVAALMNDKVNIHSRSVLCVVSGGNVDPHRIIDLMEKK